MSPSPGLPAAPLGTDTTCDAPAALNDNASISPSTMMNPGYGGVGSSRHSSFQKHSALALGVIQYDLPGLPSRTTSLRTFRNTGAPSRRYSNARFPSLVVTTP